MFLKAPAVDKPRLERAGMCEEAIIEAVRFLFYRTKLVVEPSGALGLAALLSKAVVPDGGRVGVILSGGGMICMPQAMRQAGRCTVLENHTGTKRVAVG